MNSVTAIRTSTSKICYYRVKCQHTLARQEISKQRLKLWNDLPESDYLGNELKGADLGGGFWPHTPGRPPEPAAAPPRTWGRAPATRTGCTAACCAAPGCKAPPGWPAAPHAGWGPLLCMLFKLQLYKLVGSMSPRVDLIGRFSNPLVSTILTTAFSRNRPGSRHCNEGL
jgi:hypothetical protein